LVCAIRSRFGSLDAGTDAMIMFSLVVGEHAAVTTRG
jgi:hypothetical protein